MIKRMKWGGMMIASFLAVSSCQNEEMTNLKTDQQMFKLEVTRGTGSRTTLDKEGNVYQTKWSAGDKIYVTSADGKTTGVLTLVSEAGRSEGTFSGFVFGNPDDLKYSVFPVPSNNVVDLNDLDEGQLDAPMVATITPQNTAQFENACAMVMLDIDGLPENATVSVSNANIVANAKFDAATGQLTPITTATTTVSITETKANEPVFVPLFINPNTSDTTFDLTISVNGKECKIEDVTLVTKQLSHSDIPELKYTTIGEESYLIKIVEPTENEDVNDVLSSGGSVIITEAPAEGEDNTLKIGQSSNNVPTIITLDYPLSGITIDKEGDTNPTQPIKVIVAGGITDQINVTAAEGLKVELVYQVDNAEQMTTLFENLTDAASGNTSVEVASNIDLSDVEWTPVRVDGYHGADVITVDGKGYTITGLNAALFAGGFAGGSGIVIKNWTISESVIVANNTQGYGAFVGCADSMDEITLINCHLENSSIITPNDGSAESRIGGLIGWTAGYNKQNDGPVDSYITVTGCSVKGCTLKGAGSIGGIVGHAGANAATYTNIDGCEIMNNTFHSTDTGDWRTGVVVGTANNGQCVIKNIIESGNTLIQTGKTAPTGNKRNYYGRFVPSGTGTLTIDDETIN